MTTHPPILILLGTHNPCSLHRNLSCITEIFAHTFPFYARKHWLAHVRLNQNTPINSNWVNRGRFLCFPYFMYPFSRPTQFSVNRTIPKPVWLKLFLKHLTSQHSILFREYVTQCCSGRFGENILANIWCQFIKFVLLQYFVNHFFFIKIF